MKILIFLLSITTALAQQPEIAGDILHTTISITPVQPQVGKTYRFLHVKNHAILPETIPDSTWVRIYFEPKVVTPPPVVIDTVDSESLTYASWARHGLTSAAGWYKKTISYSGTGTASYNFSGTKIQLFGETDLSNGTATVTIDNQVIQVPEIVNGVTQMTNKISWKKTKKLPALIFEKTLPAGEHSVTIKPNGDGNVTIDYLVITK